MENNIIYDVLADVVAKHLPEYGLTLIKKEEQVKKELSKYVYFVDTGHGGIDPVTGEYVSPHKQYIYKDGLAVYEGVLNRLVLDAFLDKAKSLPFELRYELTAHKWKDTPLRTRSSIINKGCKKYGNENCKSISIHHNGFRLRLSANGIETWFYSNKKTGTYSKNGKKMAKIANSKQASEMSQFRNRGIKNGNFHMVRVPKCTAILCEGAFMTNREDAIKMMSKEGIDSYATMLIEFIKQYEKDF